MTEVRDVIFEPYTCQIYNDDSDIERMATALAASLEELGV
jgi:hypothetical protein